MNNIINPILIVGGILTGAFFLFRNNDNSEDDQASLTDSGNSEEESLSLEDEAERYEALTNENAALHLANKNFESSEDYDLYEEAEEFEEITGEDAASYLSDISNKLEDDMIEDLVMVEETPEEILDNSELN